MRRLAHYRLLTKVESPPARAFYEIEATRNHWSSRELERQINRRVSWHKISPQPLLVVGQQGRPARAALAH